MNKFEKTLHFIRQAITPDSPFYGQIYLVGGCVRDELLGERYSDLDLLINLPDGQHQFVEHMCEAFPQYCKGPFYYQRYGTTAMDVIIDHTFTLVECVEPHVEQYAADGVTLLETRFCSIDEDSTRRDYTCNALYKNLHTGQVLDPTGTGIADLRAGLLRTPADPYEIYRQDPVRMLRGIRFKHQKGFRLDPRCWEAICTLHDEMHISSPKRLRDELNKLLKAPTFAAGIDDLLQSGLLTYVMPGLSDWLSRPEPLADTIAAGPDAPSAPADGADAEPADAEARGLTLWQHTRLALETLTHEHPHCDSVSKLTVLMTDIMRQAGRKETTALLLAAGIGKEKIASILHTIEAYIRYGRMFDGGVYVARPRELPHFINALTKHKDDFRRIVRALNQGFSPDRQLPWRVLYDSAALPKPGERVPTDSTPAATSLDAPRPWPKRGHRQPSRRHARGDARGTGTTRGAQTTPDDETANRLKERSRKRNQKRREQRKRQRARLKSDHQTPPPSDAQD